MWLWVDSSDDLAWGVHSLSASESGVTISARVTASKVTYDPGDGSPPVVCNSAGSSRPWNPNELMEKRSPSRCEHVYMKTNTLGDRNSRYTVSATVTWTVAWTSNDGQSGSFTLDVASAESLSIHVGEIRVVRVAPPKPVR